MGNYYAFLPVRNCKDSVGKAVSSLQKQTVPPTRITVVDDGSSDGTSEILSHLQKDDPEHVRIIATGSKTRDYSRLVRLWNMCLWHKCDYHMIAAGDTVFERDYAEILLGEMDSDPKLVVTSGEYEQVKSRVPHGAGRFVRQSFFFEHYERYPAVVGYESEILWRARIGGYRTSVFDTARFVHTAILGGHHGFVGFGFGMRALGYHPLYVLGRALYARNARMLWHYLTFRPKKTGYYSRFPDEFRSQVRKAQSELIRRKIRDLCHM